MPFTYYDAKRMVGGSKDWAVGLAASILKWEQRVRGNSAYGRSTRCGLCMVAANRSALCSDCPASHICGVGSYTEYFEYASNECILEALREICLDERSCKL